MKMSRIDRFFRLRFLKDIGLMFIIGAILLVLPMWVIKVGYQDKIDLEVLPQFQTLEIGPQHLKRNDHYFTKYLENIKSSNGIMILGTSESGNTRHPNYFGYLNRDAAILEQFSIFKGAGRFCNIYFPHILNKPEAWDSLNVLVFINPTYWRTSLDHFKRKYQDRYVSTGVYAAAAIDLKERGLFETFASEKFDAGEFVIVQRMAFVVSNWMWKLNSDIKNYKEGVSYKPIGPKEGVLQDHSQSEIDSLNSYIELEYNCSKEFVEKQKKWAFYQIGESDYRYEAVREFINLSKEFNINATYLIGPYNKVLAEKIDPEVIPDYEKVISELKTIMEEEGVPYIDASDISEVNGTFIDYQHHSKYGAYLLYQKIRDHYAKN